MMAGRKGGKVGRDDVVTSDLDDRFAETAGGDPEILAGRVDAELRLEMVREFAKIRRRKKISQTAVAHQMGTTQSAISELEKGIAEPRISTLQRYARILGYRLLWLLVKESTVTQYVDRVLHYAPPEPVHIEPTDTSTYDRSFSISGEGAQTDQPRDGATLDNVVHVQFRRKESSLGGSIAERLNTPVYERTATA